MMTPIRIGGNKTDASRSCEALVRTLVATFYTDDVVAVMNAMVEDLEEEDLVDPGYMVEEKQKDAIDLVNSKEANQNKMPKKDLDASFKFGKNLYDTMVKKANTDHLQVDSKPSQEQITQAYRNLGLVNKRK